MFERIRHFSAATPLAILAILSACAAGQPPVVEKLDELTAVTITHNRTPFVMSTDTTYDPEAARDYVQIGAIEVNRMGTLKYYLWLGISEMQYTENTDQPPEGFESIVFVVAGEEFQLDVLGWTQAAIGVSEPVFKKLFGTSVDAYYAVTLEQIQLLTEADAMIFRTTGSAPKEFVSWYKQTTAKNDLSEFFRTVLE